MAYIIVLNPIILSSAPMSPATSSSDATRRRMATPRAVTRDVLASGDIEAEMANSVVYLDTFGHIVVAWIWLQQVIAAHDCAGDFYDAKRQAARYFFRYELPKTAPQLDLVASLDHTTLAMRDSWF
jgi:Acetyl-CoA dehydrogenase C-terminal like